MNENTVALGAEMRVLGALMAFKNTYGQLRRDLLPEHFADPVNGTIFHEIGVRHAAKQAFGAEALASQMSGSGRLNEAGGSRYLFELQREAESNPLAPTVCEDVREILDRWLRRQLIMAVASLNIVGVDIAASALDEGGPRAAEQARYFTLRIRGIADEIESSIGCGA